MIRAELTWMLVVGLITGIFVGVDGVAQESEKQHSPSKKAKKAIQKFQFPDRFQVDVYASEPLLKNPVSFTFDRNGHLYVAETHRWERGVNDNRNNWYWLMDDLAARTTQDRLEKFKKWAERGKRPMSYYRKHSEKVRRIRDTDGDGVAERSNLFAGGFDSPLAGPAAGLLSYRDELFMTCIPHLWKLRDRDGDGTVEDREKLHSGFGVRTGFLGHDLHGLALGPDGRIYFSMGDRGYNVETPDGRQLVDEMDPGRGAIFRCEPDGSNLEVVHRGLRNPQELAFDRFGNLFTVDNDADVKSKPLSRLVYVVEGGDSGWGMGYQYMERWNSYDSLGAWGEEKLYQPYFNEQPEWIVPPIQHLSEGPAGLVHYPGTGFPDSYDNHFFLCDFTGTTSKSGVRTFSLEKDGASFQVDENEEFLWRNAATDVDFGYDGKMYVSDWIFNRVRIPGKGRIYTMYDPGNVDNEAVRDVRNIFQEGFDQQSVEKLVSLLSHPDQRVRLRSHLALARKGSRKATRSLQRVAGNEKQDLLARLHAIWGLGVIARRRNPEVLQPLEPLLESEQDEIRSQLLWVMGEAEYRGAAERMTDQLLADAMRVRYFAAQSLADLAYEDALKPIIQLVREHAEEHPYLKHACVEYLKEIDGNTLMQYASDPSESVRTAVVLAFRRKNDPRIARFLEDPGTNVVAEAARAIYDLNIMKVMPELAGLLNETDRFLDQKQQDRNIDRNAILRRAMSANFRLRKAKYLRNVGAFAAREQTPGTLRKFAIQLLKKWHDPRPVDPIIGRYLSFEKVEKKMVRTELERLLPKFLTSSSGELLSRFTDLASLYNLEANDQFFVRMVKERGQPPAARASALEYLSKNQHKQRSELIEEALASDHARLRIRARDLLAKHQPGAAFHELRTALEEGTISEKQAAFDTLAELEIEKVDQLLASKLDQLIKGEFPEQIQLDLLQAARRRSSKAVQEKLEAYRNSRSETDPLSGYRVALHGGDPARGEQLFRYHQGAGCIRCHGMGGDGASAGPDLSDIGARKSREYILKSLVKPSADIAQGFQLVTVHLNGGETVSGTVSKETEQILSISTPAGEVVRVDKTQIEQRSETSQSSMPPMGNVLSKDQIRDLVSYLAKLEGK